ncbi:uncharacterized protein LOC111637867 [Centruroides sculpturatus]|uniref:uncharacterized protein LOC111637867 n=1 Tax=Centruroides sculpturatus TaxID=218467 RepID=UPI000C6D663E|nr:uncharacterized protein LOC111637867 [Centruroides sculpturatus]
MVKRLLELKTFLEDLDNPSVLLTENQWKQTEKLESVLSYPYTVTLKLQAEDLTPGNFFLQWKTLMHQLDKTGGIVANAILSSMRKREIQLLDNKILLAAIYVDPMNRILLNDNQIASGKEKLREIAIRLKKLPLPYIYKSKDENKNNECNDNSESSSPKKELDFEAYLDSLERLKVKRRRLTNQETNPAEIEKIKFEQNFLNGLIEIEKYDRLSKLNVEEAISIYPEIIRDAARSVTAMPPTQVSVERLFSALKIIKADLRASMKEDLIEAILFLRTIL